MAHQSTGWQPYYAVIFSSTLEDNAEGYEVMANRMLELVRQQPGFLGYEAAREETGITISYWDSLESIAKWKQNAEHLFAQQMGIKKWYKTYDLRICKVEREYLFRREEKE